VALQHESLLRSQTDVRLGETRGDTRVGGLDIPFPMDLPRYSANSTVYRDQQVGKYGQISPQDEYFNYENEQTGGPVVTKNNGA
jgi:hypothetical protein